MSLELIERSEPRNGGWITVRCAVNGKLAIPFEVYASDLDQYRTEQEFLSFCERQAGSLLETFGDEREQRILQGGNLNGSET